MTPSGTEPAICSTAPYPLCHRGPHCLLVRDLINNRNISRTHIVISTHNISYNVSLHATLLAKQPAVRQSFIFQLLYLNKRYWRYTEIVKIYVVASRRKSLRTSATENGLTAQTRLLPLYACALAFFFPQIKTYEESVMYGKCAPGKRQKQ